MRKFVWAKKFVWASCLFIGIYSCSEEKEFDNRVNNELEKIKKIVPRQKVLTLFTTALPGCTPQRMQPFHEGSELALYITSKKTGKVYKGIEENTLRKAIAILENDRLSWKQDEPVYLDSEPVIVYAYYPYPAEKQVKESEATFYSSIDSIHIPIQISPDASQTPSYRYGSHATGQKEVNEGSPVALLTMKHALSFISFRIAQSSETKGSYLLGAVQIGNRPGKQVLAGEGILDIKTGKMTKAIPLSFPTRLSLPEPLLLTSTYSKELLLKVIPPEDLIKEGEVEVCFFINQKPYLFSIPAATQWEKGCTYTYQLLFHGDSLRLIQTTIEK